MRRVHLFLLAFFLFSSTYVFAQPAGLVVNEVSQGSSAIKEWAELVVVGPPCSSVDIRGWIIDDNNGIFIDCIGPNTGALPGAGIAPGHIRFKFDPVWQEVPVGTIILVYAWDPADPGAQAEIGALQPDYTDSNCDWLRVVPLNASDPYMEMESNIPFGASSGCCPNGSNGNPNYTPAAYTPLNNQAFSGVTGKLGLRNEGDGFQTRDANANFFHGLSYGTTSTSGCTPQPQFDGGPYGLQLAASGGNMTYQFRNTVSDDYTNVANFASFTASSTQSPGKPNNCDNAQWIGSLRRPPESIFETVNAACIPNPTASPQTICTGQTITLTLPNTNSCTSNSFSWSFTGSGSVSVQGSSNMSSVTITGTGAGTVNAVVTATISNSQLYTEGGCSGPQFPESLTYTFPLNITAGPTANPTSISACNQGNGQATFNLTSVNSVVNGNTGNPVSWYLNAAGTIPVPNPSAYTSGPGTVYAVVSSGPCSSSPVPVTLIVLPVPVAFPASLAGCNQGNGQGAYNLTTLNSIINGNSGQPVNFWIDPNATVPISNPSNYVGGPGVIYATVTGGPCTSAPVPITLTVVPNPTIANTFITVNPTIACGSTTVTVTFFFPSNNLYNITLLYGSQTFNGQNLATGATANFTINQTTPFILTSATLAQNSLCTVNFSNPPVLLVTIIDPPNLAITGDTLICIGESIDLDTVVTDLNNPPGTIPITFHTGLPPTAGNEINSVVSPATTTTYYAFANGGNNCQQTLAVTIVVSPGGMPFLGSTTVCNDDPPLDLSILLDPDFPEGTWSGPGVSNNTFDPAGLSGTQTITFTPATCGSAANTTIDILPSGTPVLGVDTLCQTDPPIDLTLLQDPNFPDGEWGGPGVSGTTFDPSGQSGTVPLVFTPVGFCANPGVADILVNEPDVPALGGDTLCSNAPPLDLTSLQDPNFAEGSWSGPGVTDTLFDPTLFSTDTLVTLTFTPSAYCTAAGTTTVWVQILALPELGTATMCDIDTLFDLTTLEDPNFPGGAWSGPGVSGTTFDPAGQAGNVVLSYAVNAFCVDTTFTTLVVVPSGTPTLSNAAICEIDGLFDLTILQDTLYPSGTWSGPGVTGSTFDPAGQGGDVPLTFTPAGSCANSANTTIHVTAGGQPVLGNTTLCDSAPVLDLSTLQDPNYPDGVWTGEGVMGMEFNPSGLSDTIVLTFTPNDTCSLAATTFVEVLNPPISVNFTETCDPSNLFYTISFEIEGGVPGTYTVNGLPVDTLFQSGPIDTGNPYTFSLDDANGCGPVVLAGTVFCNCFTDAGSMDTGAGPFQICEGDSFDAAPYFNNDAMLDGNDLIQYVLHDNAGNVLGNILDISNTGLFNYPTNATPYSSYYISVIAGNDDGTGNVDLTDPCLSVTPGVEVVFSQLDILLGPGATLCENDCFDLEITISTAPIFEYQLTAGLFTLTDTLEFNSAGLYILNICPADYSMSSGTISIQPLSMSDEICAESLASMDPIEVTVLPEAAALLDLTLCPGEELLVNNVVYNEANPVGTEVIPNGSLNGCDSIVTVALSYFFVSQNSIVQTLCDGESLTVNGAVFDASNPSGTEVIAGGSANGCDSIVIVDLSFYPPSTFSLVQDLCEGESVIVNGTVYDQNNPSGVEVVTNGSYTGCDSTITVSLNFFPASTSQVAATLCEGEFMVVNGVTYDQNNPSGTELLPNGNYLGCDSTINVDLSFYPPSTFSLVQDLCEGESVIVNGTVYDQNNPSGVEVVTNGSYTGCDSTITVSLNFFPASTSQVTATLCEGEFMVVNGVTYDQNNPSGTELLPNGNYLGCDSTIVISLGFYPPATGLLTDVLCAEDVLLINGTVYDVNNPSGTALFPGGSFNGCDSTLTVALTFLQPVEYQLIDTLSSGGSIVVNGTVYDEGHPAGTEVLINSSFQGCDSTVTIQLFFENFEALYTTVAPGCYGFQDGQLLIDAINGGKPPYSISLDGIFFEPIDAFPFALNGLSAGTYQVVIQDSNGELYYLNIVIPSKAQPILDLGPDIQLDLGESITLAASANFPIVEILWQPGTYLDCDTCITVLLENPQENITYTVTALDADGCPVTDILSVQVQKARRLYVPNTFSPNGDGINDRFMVFAGKEVREIREFQVYNRWGSLLYRAGNFQPNDPTYGWDGYFQDHLMDVGVYVFYIEVEFIDGETEIVKGGVTLVR
ncbi:MAG: gliding motility-associated C-terminal domain-containing protein [Lewinellaceae bacterium]|nr:gliding motility-associated C-terminal domain-containing protein [Lewinellaceae bacterium]